MKINEILNEMGVGGVATVAMPMGAMVRRAPGSPPKKKKKKATESEHAECSVCNGSGIDSAENACKACDGTGHKLEEGNEPRDSRNTSKEELKKREKEENRVPFDNSHKDYYKRQAEKKLKGVKEGAADGSQITCPECLGKGMKKYPHQGESEWDSCRRCDGKKTIKKGGQFDEGKKKKSAFSDKARDKSLPKAPPNLAAKHAAATTGGGAAGTHASKKDKERRPDRKQKHKGRSMDEGDNAKKKAGPPDSTSRGWEKAAKKNTNKKRRQSDRKSSGVEEAKTKSVPHAKASTKPPKPKKVRGSGGSPHPLRGRFVGGGS